MCWEGDSRLLYALGCLAILVVALAVPPVLIVRAAGDRVMLLATWLVGLVLGGLFIVVGITWIEDSAEWVYAVTAALGLVIGLAVGLRRRRRTASLAALGLVGAASPAAVPFAFIIGLLAVLGECFD